MPLLALFMTVILAFLCPGITGMELNKSITRQPLKIDFDREMLQDEDLQLARHLKSKVVKKLRTLISNFKSSQALNLKNSHILTFNNNT